MCKHVRIAVELEFDRSRKQKHVEFQLGEPGLDQLGFLLINDGTTEGLVELFGVCTSRVSPEQHLSTSATTREMFLHEHPANLLASQFEQVLQNGQVPDGVWTDLLDQDRPLAGAVERPEGNESDEEGLGGQGPRERIRIKSKTAETAAQIEADEGVLTISGRETDHESWRLLSIDERK